MLPVEALRELYEYNYWARDRQLEACSKLNEEQFARPMHNSFSSLRDTLVHLLGAEWVWYERWRGRSPRSIPSWTEEIQTLAALCARWAPVEKDIRDYLATLNHEALAQPLTYFNLKGEKWTYPVGKTVLHLANHQTYHRGQVTALLRQLGATPVQIDFLVYLDARK